MCIVQDAGQVCTRNAFLVIDKPLDPCWNAFPKLRNSLHAKIIYTPAMNPSERTKEALLAKTEALCGSIIDTRKDDPWGGDGYLSTILRAVKMQDATDYSEDDTRTEFPPALDYATSAQRELLIREQSAALIRTAQGISTLVRDLQELWLFGGLDTLSDPADEEANRTKALAVADMIEALAKQGPGGAKQNEVGVTKKEETNGGA